jgi:Dyp-type peroxidase family
MTTTQKTEVLFVKEWRDSMPTPPASSSGVQGNILKSFGRDHAVYLFVRFDDERVRPVLGNILRSFVTPADRQDEITTRRKRDREIAESRGESYDQPGVGVGMFGLSAKGYQRLGLSHLSPTDPTASSDPFRDGMQAKTSYAWDPLLESWERSYRDKEIDAFLLLAHDSPVQLAEAEVKAKTELSNIGDIVAQERGGRLRMRQSNKDLEHFGFNDGVARTPSPEKVLTPEVAHGAEQPTFGSYAVFLKIEQNVLEFDSVTAELARVAASEGVSVSAEEIRERVIGRKRNGDPLVPFKDGDPNNFTFQGEADDRCPFHAHVRMMNRREKGLEEPLVLRRGMTYGPVRTDLMAPDRQLTPPSSGVGLLFLSFQRSLYDFLGLMQRARTNRDPVLSHKKQWHPAFFNSIARTVRGSPGQRWRLGGKDIVFPIADLTNIRGGEYFYIPSMNFIKNL